MNLQNIFLKIYYIKTAINKKTADEINGCLFL